MATNTYIEPYRSKPLDSMADPTGCYNRECTSYCACKVMQWTGSWMKHTGDFDAKHWVKRLAENGFKTIVKAPVAGGKYIGVSTAGQYGHVVASEGTLAITEYNYPQPAYTGAFHERTVKDTDFTWVQIVAPNTAPTLEWTKLDQPTNYDTRLDKTHLWCVNHTEDTDCHSVKTYGKGTTLTFYGKVFNKQMNANYLVTEDNFKNRIPVGFNMADMTKSSVQPQPTLEWTKLDKTYIYETRLDKTNLWDFDHAKDVECEIVKAFNKAVKFEIVGRVLNKQINAYYLVTQDNYEHQIPVGFCEWDMSKVGEVKPSLDTDKLEQIYEEIIKQATDGVAIIKESK